MPLALAFNYLKVNGGGGFFLGGQNMYPGCILVLPKKTLNDYLSVILSERCAINYVTTSYITNDKS